MESIKRKRKRTSSLDDQLQKATTIADIRNYCIDDGKNKQPASKRSRTCIASANVLTSSTAHTSAASAEDIDTLCFYAFSAHKPAGKGVHEHISDHTVYAELNNIPHWRRMFSSLYTHDFGNYLVWRGRPYRSHSHAFQAGKFLTAGRADVAEKFCANSQDSLGANGSGLDAHKAKKIVRLSAKELSLWESAMPQCRHEIYTAKFSTPLLRRALLATGTAQLWNRGPRIKTLRNVRLENIRAKLLEPAAILEPAAANARAAASSPNCK